MLLDGSLKLLSPLPAWLKPGRTHLRLTVATAKPKRVVPSATPEMIAARLAALEYLRAIGGLSSMIEDPVAWQREIRQDRPLPGRDSGMVCDSGLTCTS